jgi:hypothetical protein
VMWWSDDSNDIQPTTKSDLVVGWFKA